MSRSLPCRVGLHTWRLVDFDQHTQRATVECERCRKRRERNGPRPDRGLDAGRQDNFGV